MPALILDSPVSNNGRGLKLLASVSDTLSAPDSPVSNNGRGLKQKCGGARRQAPTDSPVSNNGRGLKLTDAVHQRAIFGIRPLAITGVD